jgi:hypothetical protein
MLLLKGRSLIKHVPNQPVQLPKQDRPAVDGLADIHVVQLQQVELPDARVRGLRRDKGQIQSHVRGWDGLSEADDL